MKCALCESYLAFHNSVAVSVQTNNLPTVDLCHGKFYDFHIGTIYRDCVSNYLGMLPDGPVQIDDHEYRHQFASHKAAEKLIGTRAKDDQALQETLASLDHNI